MKKKTCRLSAKPLQYMIKSATVRLRETKVVIILKKENSDVRWTCLQNPHKAGFEEENASEQKEE